MDHHNFSASRSMVRLAHLLHGAPGVEPGQLLKNCRHKPARAPNERTTRKRSTGFLPVRLGQSLLTDQMSSSACVWALLRELGRNRSEKIDAVKAPRPATISRARSVMAGGPQR